MALLSRSRAVLLLSLHSTVPAPGSLLHLNDSHILNDSSNLLTRRWATKKAGGSTKNTKDSQPKNLGIKMGEGQLIYPGQIIMRQRGTKFHPGTNVSMGKDHTLHANAVGFVKFSDEPIVKMNIFRRRRFAHVVPTNTHWELDPAADQDTMVAIKAAAKKVLAKFHGTGHN